MVPLENANLYIAIQKRTPIFVATARNELKALIPVTTTLLNHQLSLAEAATSLAKGIRMKMRDLEEEESKNYGAIPRTLDQQAFRFLIGHVSEYAINQIADDWEACKQAISSDTHEQLPLEDRGCELLLRYSLPCKHHLLLCPFLTPRND